MIQGATEFLPVSSSAHLVIARDLLQLPSTGLVLEITLHLGTLLSVLVYFRHDLLSWLGGFYLRGEAGAESRREMGHIAVATVPAVAVALALGDWVEAAFDDVAFTGVMLLATTVVLASTRWAARAERRSLTPAYALIIGMMQALAILPGISRSGITIAAGLWLGLGGRGAARFSFLMSIPVILGAGVYRLLDFAGVLAQAVPGLWLGFLASAAVGYGVIAWMMRLLQRKQLHLFAGYTFLAGIVVIFWL